MRTTSGKINKPAAYKARNISPMIQYNRLQVVISYRVQFIWNLGSPLQPTPTESNKKVAQISQHHFFENVKFQSNFLPLTLDICCQLFPK